MDILKQCPVWDDMCEMIVSLNFIKDMFIARSKPGSLQVTKFLVVKLMAELLALHGCILQYPIFLRDDRNHFFKRNLKNLFQVMFFVRKLISKKDLNNIPATCVEIRGPLEISSPRFNEAIGWSWSWPWRSKAVVPEKVASSKSGGRPETKGSKFETGYLEKPQIEYMLYLLYIITYLICIHIHTCFYYICMIYIHIISCYPFPPGDIQIHMTFLGSRCKMRFYSGGGRGASCSGSNICVEKLELLSSCTRPPFGRDPATLV